MKILVLNGSPKNEHSNTMRLTEAFLKGLCVEASHEVHIVSVSQRGVAACTGCYGCWTRTPGACVIQDDMRELFPRYCDADLVIWSFPLYYFGMPSGIKAFLDRTLPVHMPYIVPREGGTATHPPRVDLSHQKHVLISTCGFYSVEHNFDALERQFRIAFGDKLSRVFCPEGELFRFPELRVTTSAYLALLREAGSEYMRLGYLPDKTQEALSQPMIPPETFMELANAQWDKELAEHGVADTGAPLGEPPDETLAFMRQMRATFNPPTAGQDRLVLEICYTDRDKLYQFHIADGKCELVQGATEPYTTRIETPYAVWKGIADGTVDRIQAMMDHDYTVLGDFSIMPRFGEIFSVPSILVPIKAVDEHPPKKTNMLVLVLPWAIMWSTVPLSAKVGASLAILMGLLILVGTKYRRTPYERVGSVALGLIGLGLFWELLPVTVLLVISKLIWAGMWLVSAAREIPMCAYYSCYGYGMGGPDAAFANRLFLRTNRILAVVWGVWGVAHAALIWLAAGPAAFPVGIMDIPITILLLWLTQWFANWYPAKVARGAKKRA